MEEHNACPDSIITAIVRAYMGACVSETGGSGGSARFLMPIRPSESYPTTPHPNFESQAAGAVDHHRAKALSYRFASSRIRGNKQWFTLPTAPGSTKTSSLADSFGGSTYVAVSAHSETTYLYQLRCLFILHYFALPPTVRKIQIETHIDGAGHGWRRPYSRERDRLAHAPQSRDAEESSRSRASSSYPRLRRVTETYSSATASDCAKQTEHVVPAVYRNTHTHGGGRRERAGEKVVCGGARRDKEQASYVSSAALRTLKTAPRELTRTLRGVARSEMARCHPQETICCRRLDPCQSRENAVL